MFISVLYNVYGIKEKDALKDIQKGDFASFETIFSTHYNPLCNFAYLFTKDKELSKDIVSDLFVKIWQKREQLSITSNLKSYLYISTKNAVISHIRKTKNLSSEDLDTKLEPLASCTPETILLKKEFQDKIDQLFEELPKKSGLVFRLKKIDGLSYKEISEIMNISEKTVENHIAAAVKKLKTLLAKNPELSNFFRPKT